MKTLRIMGKYFIINISSALEYRASFLGQAVGIAVSNSSFILFWMIAFDKIGGSIGGYGFNDILFLWSIVPLSYGLCMVVFGNVTSLTRMIVSGELDTYLLYPGNLPINLLCARSDIMAWGDVLYGILLFALTQGASLAQWCLFLLCGITGALLIMATLLLANSLSFFFGDTSALSSMATEFIINFSIYPKGIYDAFVRIIMMTIIPAIFIAHFPMEIITELNLAKLAFLAIYVVVYLFIASAVFYAGLKHYESGNAIVTKL